MINFNPRSHERSDSCSHAIRFTISLFQSTLPREERQLLTCNPVHHIIISIHAPTRGATRPQMLSLPHAAISIHAPTRGATQRRSLRQSCEQISIHAPTRGATLITMLRERTVLFQSTLPREERQRQKGTVQT